MSKIKLSDLKIKLNGSECRLSTTMYLIVEDNEGVGHSVLPHEIEVELPETTKTLSLAELLGQQVKTIEFK